MKAAREAVQETPIADARTFRIAVSHPHGNANSYHAAMAFSEQNWLHSFQTGILETPAISRVMGRLPGDIERRARNRNYEEIPGAGKTSHFFFETVSRIGSRLKPRGLTSRVNWYDVLFTGHDFEVSNSIEGLDAIYAYEDAAKRTFEAARKRGITTIYELPLGYYKGVADEINRARADWPNLQPKVYAEPDWKQRRKDAELELADVILVASKWARESVSASRALSGKPIITVPYGTPAGEILPRTKAPDGPFTVLFAGQIGLRKGVPHLIEAWEKLKLSDSRLWLAGSINLPREYMSAHASSFQYLGALPRAELLEVMSTVDLFVFPSLADGFGLVIGEAMASGVPVLTTTNTGGPDLITDGNEGWCVAAHAVEPLAERIEWAHRHPDRLYEMGQCARRSAERWTWAGYRHKLIAEIAPHLRVNEVYW